VICPDSGKRRWFQRRLLAWYRRHGRDLPWRRTDDPYRVLVSEIMLQQTQVDRVIPKYHEFLGRYPTLEDLAGAPTRSAASGTRWGTTCGR
jgi:A/G-specific adenine glycosylase